MRVESPMITLSSVTLMRGTKYLLDDASLSVHEKQKAGIIGRNGCGKSSLFQAILGELSVQKGTVSLPKSLKISVLKQQTPALPMSAIDYVMAGDFKLMKLYAQKEQALKDNDGERIALIEDKLGIAGAWTINARAEQLLHGLGFADDEFLKPVKDFSGGMRMRLNLGQALIAPSDLLLLDEPTNHLDLDTILYVQDYLKKYPGTLMCISHDRDFLDSFCTHIISFEGGKLSTYKGNYSSYERLRAEKIKAQKAARKKEEALLSHMQSFVDRFRYKATKAKQAQSLIKAMEKMKLTAVTAEESPFSFAFPDPSRTAEVIASFDKAALGYDAKTQVLHDLNLQILRGDRIGLLGRNGQGKSTLIKGLCGIIKPKTGTITLGKDLVLGYFAQHELEMLSPGQTVLQHFCMLDPKAREGDLRQFLGTFAFTGDMVFHEVKSLSGGEQARLALALIAYQKPNLLVLDEPANHLDLAMREALALALASYNGALIAVSHDRHLLQAVADKLWLVNDGTVREFEGSLDDYAVLLQKQTRMHARGALRGALMQKGDGSIKDGKAKAADKANQENTANTADGANKTKGQMPVSSQHGAGIDAADAAGGADGADEGAASASAAGGKGGAGGAGTDEEGKAGAGCEGKKGGAGADAGCEGKGEKGKGPSQEHAAGLKDSTDLLNKNRQDHKKTNDQACVDASFKEGAATLLAGEDTKASDASTLGGARESYGTAAAGFARAGADGFASSDLKGEPEGAQAGSARAARSAKLSKDRKRLEAQHRAALRPLKLEIEKLEKKMDEVKGEITKTDEILADQTLYQDGKRKGKLEKLLVHRASLQNSLDDLEERWLLKSALLDEERAKQQEELR